MSATVNEIMNPELFHLRRTDTVAAARNGILGMEITAAPVLDDDGRPIGVVSLRDLEGADDQGRVDERMTSPAVVARASASVRDAARLLDETGLRHLVVIDELGCAVGMLSSLDVVRGLIGAPARHPAGFPHLDERTGLIWTDAMPLSDDWAHLAPDGPGLLALVHDAPGQPAHVVWVEWSHNTRSRLLDWLSGPQEQAELARWLGRPEHVFFRAAAQPDENAAAAIVDEMRPRHLPEPSPRALR